MILFYKSKLTILISSFTVLQLLLCNNVNNAFVTVLPFQPSTKERLISSSMQWMANPAKDRENEIRRKIMALKKEGRLKKGSNKEENNIVNDEMSDISDPNIEKIRENRMKMKKNAAMSNYDDKIAQKLGGSKKISSLNAKMGRPLRGVSETQTTNNIERKTSEKKIVLGRQQTSNYNLLDDEDDETDLEEEALVDLIAKKLEEKQLREATERLTNEGEENEVQLKNVETNEKTESSDGLKKKTTGVGGNWKKSESQPEADYTPVRGSWGAFPRPRDISKAYGGGRQIGAGVDGDLTNKMKLSEEDTRAKLRAYRERVGIDVQSEKDNADTIDEAMKIASLAMQRGIYTTAVSALEKVTKYCSTNSKVGGQVFLELAMAYEASGRTEEAVTVYTTLTKSRMENIKYNAKRLLYGIEAMNFMRNDAKIESFSRKAAASTFIDTTGLANFANNFDDRYETAYVDLDKSGGFYKRLTENVVRSHREARQVLMVARDSGEVDRLRVLQALRSMARNFDEQLSNEKQRARVAKASKEEEDSVAIMNGKPIRKKKDLQTDIPVVNIDKFNLASPSQMIENLNGEWRLQLMADKKGDTVKYFNSTLSWQSVDSSTKKFKSFCPAGFIKTSQEGTFSFDEEQRVLSRDITSSSGTAGFLSGAVLGSGSYRTGAAAAALSPQQIICVDSSLCVSRLYGLKLSPIDNVKDYYCVWRKVKSGTYCK